MSATYQTNPLAHVLKNSPVMLECIAFIRYATPKEIAEYEMGGLFTEAQIRKARQIIKNGG